MNWMARVVAALCCAVMLVTAAVAQQDVAAASVSGKVMDPSGAVIPGAQVIATEVDTNQMQYAVTDAAGRYRFPYLRIGRYRLTAEAKGLAADVHVLDLSVGAAVDLPFRLALPTVNAETRVEAVEETVETARSQVAETVSEAEVDNLPVEGRNSLDLGLLLPGVSSTNTASTQALAETSEVIGQGYSVNSQRNFSNSFVVDGLSDNDDAAGVAGNVFSMDAVREFQVVTSGGQAELGRAMGGYFNLVTRSGTNQLRGTVYGFLRSQRLNAENALSQSKLPLTDGQYGVSFGGPLRKDRTFLFGNFEERRFRTDGVITVTAANAAAIDAKLTAVGYAAPLLPVVSTPTTQYPTTIHTDTVFVRGDQKVSANDSLTMRYSLYQLSSLNARGVGSLNEVSNGTSVYDTNHAVAFGNVWTVNARTFNETRGQFIYDNLYAPPNDQVGPAVTISGVAVFGRSTSSPTGRLNYLGELVDNLTLQRGAHTFKVGADFLINHDTITFPQSIRGSYTFASLAAFQAGTYNTQGFTQNFGSTKVEQQNPNVGMYAQDEWKAANGLTVNLGVRYDLEFLPTITTALRNVSPRVGLAWAPYANRKTVVRASYGLFYDRVPLRPLANALLSAKNTTDPSQAMLLSYTFSPLQAGAPAFPAVASGPPSGALVNYSLMQRNIQNPVAQQISLGVEQALGVRNSVGVSWQHVRGEHLIAAYNTNINVDGTRPDPTRGNIKPYSSAFDSYFDGLEVSVVERPAARWGMVRLSYVYSKAIDDVSEFFFSSPINNFNIGEDRSRSDDDQRHRLVMEANLQAPQGPGHGWAEHVTHGWKLSGVLSYTSKLPFNVTTGTTTKQGTTQRPCTAGYTLTGTTPCTEALPGAVIGRNAGIGFDFFSLNARLGRTFSLGERIKLEAMAEAFNALNRRNNMVPNGTFGTGAYPTAPSGTFGNATAVGDPRNVQLGARVSW